MPLTLDQMMTSPHRHGIIRFLATAFVEGNEANARMGDVFATQQRWMLAHAGMSIYFRALSGEGPPLHSRNFLEKVETDNLAARHTAHSFMLQMLKYGILLRRPTQEKSKIRAIDMSETALVLIANWFMLHLNALDAFDDGTRNQALQHNAALLHRLQPALADRLIASTDMRIPKGTFARFTWLNNGGFIMDYLMSRLQPEPEHGGRIMTNVISISELAERARLSRTHLGRKLQEAEEEGALGWTGRRGQSTLWVSQEFRHEYDLYQMSKLVLIDNAFSAVLRL